LRTGQAAGLRSFDDIQPWKPWTRLAAAAVGGFVAGGSLKLPISRQTAVFTAAI
jgi:hypothetical protein